MQQLTSTSSFIDIILWTPCYSSGFLQWTIALFIVCSFSARTEE